MPHDSTVKFVNCLDLFFRISDIPAHTHMASNLTYSSVTHGLYKHTCAHLSANFVSFSYNSQSSHLQLGQGTRCPSG